MKMKKKGCLGGTEGEGGTGHIGCLWGQVFAAFNFTAAPNPTAASDPTPAAAPNSTPLLPLIPFPLLPLLMLPLLSLLWPG